MMERTSLATAAVVAVLSATLSGCAAIAEKRNSWIGYNWHDYEASMSGYERDKGGCYPTQPGVVSCYYNDWTVDSSGTITGWMGNSRY